MAIRGYEVYLDDVVTYPGTAQITLPFYGNSVSIVSDHPTAVIYASLSGVTDDASFNGARTAGIELQTPVKQLWLRREDVEVDPTTVLVRVIAEEIDQ